MVKAEKRTGLNIRKEDPFNRCEVKTCQKLNSKWRLEYSGEWIVYCDSCWDALVSEGIYSPWQSTKPSTGVFNPPTLAELYKMVYLDTVSLAPSKLIVPPEMLEKLVKDQE